MYTGIILKFPVSFKRSGQEYNYGNSDEGNDPVSDKYCIVSQ